MSSCNVDHSDSRNNGLITKIWGGPGWTFNHAVTFGYPVDPTDEQKKNYKDFFISLGNVLPCRFCRESYQKFITSGETALTDEVFTNRETLTKWFYKIHEMVNHKLEIDYGVTYEDIVDRYESFRARCNMTDPAIKGCVTPLDYKAFSYRKLAQLDCPIVSYESVKPFVQLAILRGIDHKYLSFMELVSKFDGNITKLKKQEVWPMRNVICQKQIRFMRETAKPSIEESGIWVGTPTIEELKLFVLLCSNLNKSEIKKCTAELLKKPSYLLQLNSIH